MADLLPFDLVSPERLLRSGEVFMVVVPGTEGDFGVLVGHAPLVSTIRPGVIAVYPAGFGDTPERIFVDGGFAEVGPGGLTVLADRATPVGELNVEAAARDLAAAREAMKGATGDALAAAEANIARLEAMQAVAVN